jgi:hypothetical protein
LSKFYFQYNYREIPDKGENMLIEVFTNGKVMIDGNDTGKQYHAQDALYDYLTKSEGFLQVKAAKVKKAV